MLFCKRMLVLYNIYASLKWTKQPTICNILTFMKNYIKTVSLESESPIMQIKHNNELYRINLLYSKIETSGGADFNKPIVKKDQHSHPLYHIILFKKGEYHYCQDDKKYSFAPRVLALTNPNDLHKFGPFITKQKVENYVLTFTFENVFENKTLAEDISYQTNQANFVDESFLLIPFKKLLEYFSGRELKDICGPQKLNERQYTTLSDLIITLTNRLNNQDKNHSLDIYLATLNVFNFLTKELFCKVAKLKIENNSSLEKVRLYIENNYKKKITLEELSKIAFLSPNYLIKAYKSAYKTTPLNYQIELKIHAAKTLLISSDMRINEIAKEVGVDDCYYFSKLFKKHRLMSPSKYRKKYFSY